MPQVSDIRLMVRAEQPVLSARIKVSYNNLEGMFARKREDALSLLRKTGVYMTDVPFIIYYDFMNLDMYDLDVEFCFPVSCLMEGNEGVQPRVIPQSKVVHCLFKGDYDEMDYLYGEMTSWMMQKGYEPEGTAYEYYYRRKEEPYDDRLTKIVLPVKS
ncbi:GyrI-like domain-containing protein [Parabacteroides faecis]|uniref:GyrI-like domain-containing protein n=1 Tax=Parabacteroides TaxID=375288 RepID=UPI000EFDEADA|nr:MULTISPECIES: GyrI-like domain-containing protein [Parabacteroides]MBC8616308.1 GyrI-like domain-containing protein [Parabacteroides faecis]RHR98330.1 AraC family transcriptional regulator [Parabacteroides sp. AF14-59]